MNDDEKADRLVNVLKGSAYLISSYLVGIGTSISVTTFLTSMTFVYIFNKGLIPLVPSFIWDGSILGGVLTSNDLNKKAKRFLE